MWVFTLDVTENPERTFWPTQYFKNISSWFILYVLYRFSVKIETKFVLTHWLPLFVLHKKNLCWNKKQSDMKGSVGEKLSASFPRLSHSIALSLILCYLVSFNVASFLFTWTMKIHLLTKSCKILLSVTWCMCEDLASESFKNQFIGDFFCFILFDFVGFFGCYAQQAGS